MQSAAQHAAPLRAAISLRTGSARDIDVLVELDSDSSVLFEQAGLWLAFHAEHEVAVAERNRWLRCLAAGTVLIAVNSAGEDVGFAAVGLRDGEPYLDQLSVRVTSMRQGIGTQLLYGAINMAERMGGRALWLTTYRHLAWNRPYYERHGFEVVPPAECAPELGCELQFERRLLPAPEQRVVMRRRFAVDAV